MYNYDTHNHFQYKTISQKRSLNMFINRKFMSIYRKKPFYLRFFKGQP